MGWIRGDSVWHRIERAKREVRVGVVCAMKMPLRMVGSVVGVMEMDPGGRICASRFAVNLRMQSTSLRLFGTRCFLLHQLRQEVAVVVVESSLCSSHFQRRDNWALHISLNTTCTLLRRHNLYGRFLARTHRALEEPKSSHDALQLQQQLRPPQLRVRARAHDRDATVGFERVGRVWQPPHRGDSRALRVAFAALR